MCVDEEQEAGEAVAFVDDDVDDDVDNDVDDDVDDDSVHRQPSDTVHHEQEPPPRVMQKKVAHQTGKTEDETDMSNLVPCVSAGTPLSLPP